MIRLVSAAKLNLGLRITGRRPDGRHELASVFYPIPWPKDDIFIRLITEKKCKVAPVTGIETGENIIAKAWRIFADASGFTPGLEIALRKRVPIGAGLGGGSANAASFLKWLNAQAPKPLPEKELLEIAAKIGADVPFFIYNSPCRVSGIGEKLKPMRMDWQGLSAVLVCPDISVSTAWAFKEWDKQGVRADRPEKNMRGQENCLTNAASKSKNSNSVEVRQAGSQDLHNDLEAVVFAVHPELPALKREILNLGALNAAMSGSGSSIYGIFPDGPAANLAATMLRAKWPRVYCLPIGSHAGM